MSACSVRVEVGTWTWGRSNRDRDWNMRDCVLEGVVQRLESWEDGRSEASRGKETRSEVDLFLLWGRGAQSVRRITTWIG